MRVISVNRKQNHPFDTITLPDYWPVTRQDYMTKEFHSVSNARILPLLLNTPQMAQSPFTTFAETSSRCRDYLMFQVTRD